jgi:hypothetical protein
VRGQNPQSYEPDSSFGQPGGFPPETYAAPVDPNAGSGGLLTPFSQPTPTFDPFLGQGGYQGGLDPMGNPGCYGVLGPQPYRLGWSSYFDGAFLPTRTVDGQGGSMQITEINAALRYTTPFTSLAVFSWTPEFNARFWEGPSTVGLPGSAYRIASDFEITTTAQSPVNLQLGFTPQIGSDFQDNLNSNSYFWDGRAALFVRASPQWMFVLGAAFWDRVHDRVIPYAGVVWNPDDRWEFRLLFPKSRISYFLGNIGNAAVWFYGSGEFHVEAYNVSLDIPPGTRSQIEISDYRLLLGLRSEAGGVSSFVEGGWVIDRQVSFSALPSGGFDIGNGYVIRAGIRF